MPIYIMRDKSTIGYVAIIVFVIVVVCFYIYVSEIGRLVNYTATFPDGQLEKTGLLGDSAGLLNALFSGLAFGGVILTIVWQIKNDNRNKLNNQKLQFENTFFNMTQTFEHIVDGLFIEEIAKETSGSTGVLLSNYYGNSQAEDSQHDSKNDAEIKGRAVFKYVYCEQKIEGKSLRESIAESELTPYEFAVNGVFDHYFRYLYRILKFIDETELIDDDQKYRYSSIFRAQLSEYELVLIYYNGLSSVGKDKLKPLLEKYSILKNIRKDDLASRKDRDDNEVICLLDDYSTSAFTHINHLNGDWLRIIVNVFFLSFMLILTLELCSNWLKAFLFKDLLSIPLFKEHNGVIVLFLIVFCLYHLVQTFFAYRLVMVKKRDFPQIWDKFRFMLSYYYDAKNLQIILPIIIGFFYICGFYEWYGYGFLLYVDLIIFCMLIRPLVALGFACYQMYKFK